MSVAAVFLDKDGTLIEDVPYNVDPESIRLAHGALPALAKLHRAGYVLVVVTNQCGVAFGKFPESALAAVEACLRSRLAAARVPLAAMYWCPHHPGGVLARYAVQCACRKPRPGLLWRAAQAHGIDLGRSWLIGDILDDVEAGRRAGCRTVLLDNGNETQWRMSSLRVPHRLVPDLSRAADAIVDTARRPSTSAAAR